MPQSDSPSLPDGLADRIAALRGRPCEVSELAGGLTNRNYKVATPEGTYVVRVSPPPGDGLVINRDHEHRNSVIAAETGVGAPVIEYLPQDRTMVIGFIAGQTFSDATFSEPANVQRVAEACRRLHAGKPFANEFDMFEIQAGYLDKVVRHGYRLPVGYLSFARQVRHLHEVLEVGFEGLVPCHNDLLAGNFVDDGQAVRIIDYEYAGNNDPCFELGNIWSECHLDLDQLEELVTAYYGRPRPSRVARARLLGLMSQYGWTLWASIQDATSPIEFDYWEWGLEKYERAVATFRGPELDRLLEQAQLVD